MLVATECPPPYNEPFADDVAETDFDPDRIIQLREWASDIVHKLPRWPSPLGTIGTAEQCAIRLDDSTGDVAPLHAQLVHYRGKWQVYDLGAGGGLYLDGERRSSLLLEAGVEVGIGRTTLVAENRDSIALRKFVRRLLGWGAPHNEATDLALRSIRLAEARRTALVLSGAEELVSIARSLHRRLLGPDRPFILCDPRRANRRATVRTAETCSDGMLALMAADGGTLCVRAQYPPPEMSDMVAQLRDPRLRVRLVICTHMTRYWEPLVASLVVPPIADRSDEVDRVIREYANDAYMELGILRAEPLSPRDHEWIRQAASTSFLDIEKATLRVMALRGSRNTSQAAHRLGMEPVSLARWFARRNPQLPPSANRDSAHGAVAKEPGRKRLRARAKAVDAAQ